MTVAWAVWAAALWVTAMAAPAPQFDAQSVAADGIPLGQIVTSFQHAQPISVAVTNNGGQELNLDDIFRQLTGSGGSIISADFISGPLNPSFGAPPSAVSPLINLQGNNVNRQGFLLSSAEDDLFELPDSAEDGGLRIVNTGSGFVSPGVSFGGPGVGGAGVGGAGLGGAGFGGAGVGGAGLGGAGFGGAGLGGAGLGGGGGAPVGVPLPSFGSGGGSLGGGSFGGGDGGFSLGGAGGSLGGGGAGGSFGVPLPGLGGSGVSLGGGGTSFGGNTVVTGGSSVSVSSGPGNAYLPPPPPIALATPSNEYLPPAQTKPAVLAPAVIEPAFTSPTLPIKSISQNTLGALLGGLTKTGFDPSQTFGSALRGLNGQDGIVVVGINSDEDHDDIFDDIDIDTVSLEDDRAFVFPAGGGGGSASLGGSGGGVGNGLLGAGVIGAKKAVLGPKFLFQGPLSDILLTKGQWLGTLLGGLVDIGDTVVRGLSKDKNKLF